MKYLFYSTNSNYYSESAFIYKNIPEYKSLWNELKDKNPNDEYILLIQKPAIFLYDKSLEYLLNENKSHDNFLQIQFIDKISIQEIAKIIVNYQPDFAIAATYWASPFDWMTIKDSLIAEEVKKFGINAICHSPKSAYLCYDKKETHDFLVKNNFKTAKALYINHQQYWIERNKQNIEENIYKEYIHSNLKNMNYPLVIKDTRGLSSYGMDVVHTYKEALHILNSKKNNGDRLVEEFISGDSFGIEIYGNKTNYFISEVLINSVNQFGLTSPKQNVKLGPVTQEKYKLNHLKEEMLRLAKLLDFNGIAQVDLIFHKGEWYIVEINSRISGMTQTLSSIYGISIFELLISICKNDFSNLKSKNFSCNLKFPLLSSDLLSKLYKQDFVDYVNQIENKEAKQLREMGYSEVVFSSNQSLENLIEKLEILNEEFKDKMEFIFYENTKKLYQSICS